jgi:serine protease inhibitor
MEVVMTRWLSLIALLWTAQTQAQTNLPQKQPVSGTTEVQAVIAANNQFALDLYQQLGSKDGNLFFSPYCISKTLAMVHAGARGDTEKEMAAVLHFSFGQDRLHKAFLETRHALNGGKSTFNIPSPFRSNHDVQLHLSANLWGQRGYGFQRSYLSLVKDYYGGELQEVDFAASEAARKKINAWVEKQTRNKIKELFQAGTIDANTRLVLASAIYFKGDWVQPFKKSGTRDDTFWIAPEKKAQVRLMSQTATFGYFENEELQGLQMPYQGKNLAMIVLLPTKKDGLADLEKNLTAKKLASCVDGFREQKVQVQLPKFTLRSGFDLKQTLEIMGMKKPFGLDADFSGMTGSKEPLVISKVVHQAFVEVNEEGTEAAAATGVSMALYTASPAGPRMPVFRADHPFVFAIRDVRTGVILFMGRFANP